MQATANAGSTFLRNVLRLLWTQKNCASGRWYPQPEKRLLCTVPSKPGDSVSAPNSSVVLDKDNAAPVYYKPKGTGKGYALVPGQKGELLANYPLFEDSINKATIPWNNYNGLTSEERNIYMKHLDAVQKRKMTYEDPKTKLYELSKHRTRPPSMGIHRRTRCNVVDNSALGKEAHIAGKLAYCIHVYKQGRRQKHMPHATLGDKILVAIRGEMRKAFVVGANTHVHYRKHGVPVTDTNNIVLLDEEGNPLGNRITAPVPSKLLEKRNNVQFNKVITLANKFI